MTSLRTLVPDPIRDQVDTDALAACSPATDVRAYYQAVDAREGTALLRQLHELSATRHRPRSWDGARSMLFRVIEDLDRDDVVTDLYSGRRIPDVDGLQAATRAGLTTEHVWPQSEGATAVARSDLHHLRPALMELNSHRSNLPYGDVVAAEWTSPPVPGVDGRSRVGSDVSGATVFSARESMRGDVARDQLYFYTRYLEDRPTGYSEGNFLHSLPTLLRWHRDDPVSDAERARNDAIARVQGNRNPYVDHPEFVDRIGFSPDLVRALDRR